MKSFKELRDSFFDESIDLNNRLLTVILFGIIAGTIIGLIPMLFGNTQGWWINILIMILAIISQIINIVFKKNELATFFISITGIIFALPIMYFKQGGAASGMPFWLMFGVLTAFIMLNGWRRYVTVSIAVLIFTCCFITEFLFPETVVRLETRQAIYTDVIISFISTTVIFLSMLGIYLKAYAVKREKLDYALHYDALTGIENRYAYEKYLQELIKKPLSENLIFISADVNSLKKVNDTQGHIAGDELLKGAAQIFSESFGNYGKVFRTGGDEFQATIFTDKDLNDIQHSFENNMSNWSGKLVKEIHISIGYATTRTHPTTSYVDLAKAADQAMYKDKAAYYSRNGFNRRSSR